MNLEIHLCTLDPDMATAWQECFSKESHVQITVGSILDQKADAILSPSNSFGFMDGGIDLAYSHCFGWELEARLKSTIAHQYSGELPVGCAVVVPTGHTRIPFLVSAPTMRVPARIMDTVNAYLAFRAALLAVRQFNLSSQYPLRSLLAPALGAGIGGMPFRRVARQMHAAFVEIIQGQSP